MLELHRPADRARHPHRHVEGCQRRVRDLMPAHPTQLFPVPDNVSDELAVFADPFAVSLHAITRHSPPAGGRVLVLRRRRARNVRGRDSPSALSPTSRSASSPGSRVRASWRASWCEGGLPPLAGQGIDRARRPSGRAGSCAATTISRWRTRAGSTWCTTPSRRRRASKRESALLKAHGTLVKAGVHGPTSWEWTPLYFKEISWVGSNTFGLEEVDGVCRHGIDHYLDLASSGRVDLSEMLTHKFALDDWRAAFTALATQEDSGAMKNHVRSAGHDGSDRGAPARHGDARRNPGRGRDHPWRPAVRSRGQCLRATCDSTSRRRTLLPTPSSERSRRSSCRRGPQARGDRSRSVSLAPRDPFVDGAAKGARPALLFGESLQAMLGVQAHPDWQAALRRRGCSTTSRRSRSIRGPRGRWVPRTRKAGASVDASPTSRESPSDNGSARRIEGLIAFFDQGRGRRARSGRPRRRPDAARTARTCPAEDRSDA